MRNYFNQHVMRSLTSRLSYPFNVGVPMLHIVVNKDGAPVGRTHVSTEGPMNKNKNELEVVVGSPCAGEVGRERLGRSE